MKCKKEDILTFSNALEDYFIFHKKIGHVLQRGPVVALLNNSTLKLPVQI